MIGGAKTRCSDSATEPQAAGDPAAEQKLRQATLTGALFALPKPTLAALPGAAAGAGMSIALVRRPRRPFPSDPRASSLLSCAFQREMHRVGPNCARSPNIFNWPIATITGLKSPRMWAKPLNLHSPLS